MITRKYDKFNSRCYIFVKCDFCSFKVVHTDGYGVTSKTMFSELEKVGWKRFHDGKIICASCQDALNFSH